MSCVADSDVWMKPIVNNTGFSYWSYMLIYVNDCLAVCHNPGSNIEDLKSHYKLKNNMYGEPEKYLGANIGKYQFKHNRRKSYWSIHAYDYVVESFKMVHKWSVRDGHKFNNKREDAMKVNHHPEIDIYHKLGDNLATQFQQMIGIL